MGCLPRFQEQLKIQIWGVDFRIPSNQNNETSAKSSVTISFEIKLELFENHYWKLKCFSVAKNMEFWRQMHIFKP